jgi:hypothetical protein
MNKKANCNKGKGPAAAAGPFEPSTAIPIRHAIVCCSGSVPVRLRSGRSHGGASYGVACRLPNPARLRSGCTDRNRGQRPGFGCRALSARHWATRQSRVRLGIGGRRGDSRALVLGGASVAPGLSGDVIGWPVHCGPEPDAPSVALPHLDGHRAAFGAVPGPRQSGGVGTAHYGIAVHDVIGGSQFEQCATMCVGKRSKSEKDAPFVCAPSGGRDAAWSRDVGASAGLVGWSEFSLR